MLHRFFHCLVRSHSSFESLPNCHLFGVASPTLSSKKEFPAVYSPLASVQASTEALIPLDYFCLCVFVAVSLSIDWVKLQSENHFLLTSFPPVSSPGGWLMRPNNPCRDVTKYGPVVGGLSMAQWQVGCTRDGKNLVFGFMQLLTCWVTLSKFLNHSRPLCIPVWKVRQWSDDV